MSGTSDNPRNSKVDAFFSETFGALTLSVMALYEAWLLALFLLPVGSSHFADEFRVWCFGYNPATGAYEWALVGAMLVPPWLLAAFIVTVWWGPLARIASEPARFGRVLLAAAMIVSLLAGGSIVLADGPATGELPFPADEIRTAHERPDIQLTDHRGESFDLASLEGDVVVLTAVYASCVHTCPAIVAQVKGALAGLSDNERGDVHLVAVTIDPENDTPDRLAELAKMHGLLAGDHLLTGEVDLVNGILDRMEVARSTDPETGVIGHTNVVVVLDRLGDVAYRFSLGERQQRWLGSAVRILLAEPAKVVQR